MLVAGIFRKTERKSRRHNEGQCVVFCRTRRDAGLVAGCASGRKGTTRRAKEDESGHLNC